MLTVARRFLGAALAGMLLAAAVSLTPTPAAGLLPGDPGSVRRLRWWAWWRSAAGPGRGLRSDAGQGGRGGSCAGGLSRGRCPTYDRGGHRRVRLHHLHRRAGVGAVPGPGPAQRHGRQHYNPAGDPTAGAGLQALLNSHETWVAGRRNLLEFRRPRWNRAMGGQEVPVFIRLDCGPRSLGGLAGLSHRKSRRGEFEGRFSLLSNSARGVL